MERSFENVTISEIECQTIIKQRQELQLLIGELKNRDRELNDMVSAHRQQLTAWDKDRQRLISLEKRNTKLEYEIRKRNDQLRLLVNRLKLSETNHSSKDTVIETTQSKLIAAKNAIDQSTMAQQELKETNEKLNDSMNDLSDKIGRLESKEHDLVTQLQLKNGELVEAESEISELSSKLRRFEAEFKELEEQSILARGDLDQQRSKYRQCRSELDKCTAEMATKTGEVIALRQEVTKLTDQAQMLRKEFYMAEEQLKRREEVIQLQQSKQQRADVELAQLRQLYERQQEELTVLQINLENSQDLLAKQEEKLNLINLNQLELDQFECCSQTTNDLIEEARRTADDHSYLLTSTKTSSSNYNLHSSPKNESFGTSSGHSPSPTHFAPSTSKLQKLLTESRQMAQNLEKTAHFPTRSYY